MNTCTVFVVQRICFLKKLKEYAAGIDAAALEIAIKGVAASFEAME